MNDYYICEYFVEFSETIYVEAVIVIKVKCKQK